MPINQTGQPEHVTLVLCYGSSCCFFCERSDVRTRPLPLFTFVRFFRDLPSPLSANVIIEWPQTQPAVFV